MSTRSSKFPRAVSLSSTNSTRLRHALRRSFSAYLDGVSGQLRLHPAYPVARRRPARHHGVTQVPVMATAIIQMPAHRDVGHGRRSRRRRQDHLGAGGQTRIRTTARWKTIPICPRCYATRSRTSSSTTKISRPANGSRVMRWTDAKAWRRRDSQIDRARGKSQGLIGLARIKLVQLVTADLWRPGSEWSDPYRQRLEPAKATHGARFRVGATFSSIFG